MNNYDERIIETSKIKLVLLTIASGVFVALGYWLYTLSDVEIATLHRYNNPLFVHGLGLVCMLFFAICGVIGIKKLLEDKPGLIFNRKGIIDNASAVSAGLIPWSDILGFEVMKINHQKIIIVKLINPESYMDANDPIKKWLIKVSHKMNGSPIAFSSNSLKINADAIIALCNEYLNKYGKIASHQNK
ncbi:MAG: STM3941 family protein [Methylophilaceae bacterium]